MRRILKFPLNEYGDTVISPPGRVTRWLAVERQPRDLRGQLVVWAEVDVDSQQPDISVPQGRLTPPDIAPWVLKAIYTGDFIPEGWTYIGTAAYDLVVHVFWSIQPAEKP